MSELAYAGLVATVDGTPAPLAPAATLGVAIPVPAGKHAVSLRYGSRWLRGGLLISFVTLLAIVIGGVARWTTARDATASWISAASSAPAGRVTDRTSS